MRVVEFTEITLPKDHFLTKDRYYGVRLGNGFTCYFTSKRSADAFVVATKQFLTDCLIELNELYIIVWTDYRKNWFYFTGRTEKKQKVMHKLEYDIVQDLQRIEYCFAKIQRANDNFQPWKLLSNSLESILKISEKLWEVRRKRNEYVERKNIEILAKRCRLLIQTMSDYGSQQKNDYSIINQMFAVRERLTGSLFRTN